MITRAGITYWTTDELAASLVARGEIDRRGTKREVLRRARRWAAAADLRPSATTRTGGLLWGEEETREAMALTQA